MIVGLTGGIASGKSQVSRWFEELGITVVDADIVAREVVNIGQPALAQIEEYFGQTILLENGQLNRAKLRQEIFADEDKKNWLNQLMHPLIRETMLTQLNQAQGAYKILVAPLLLENQLHKLVDRVLVVDASTNVQIERTMARDNVSANQAQQIIDAQMKREAKLAAADDIIENDADLPTLQLKVKALHQFYLDLSKSHDS
ncbi:MULTISPECIES: dephospho-CoA kinase [unclassified Agarivorans]|uniref:dephospho-CoA kinase n=1 Tax=unclassified Agarivorans TaxID=2636026 RepID=UPI0026E347E9|nr:MULTISPECIES: dephospho-CoA kinase [unclassified Agarivorans]MDO6686923.1 dephospho-CoA kinase [Agarivorans sp. 3_MG-2023]MDO6716720.1 dephospho-CoA kinase [Agarivorans sp. 2_MG-2023]